MNLQDSGKRVEFKTGAQREVVPGKGKYVLISPIMLKRLADALEAGAIKYSDRNWEKGLPLSSCVDSAYRHLTKMADGLEDEDHAALLLCNIMFYIHLKHKIDIGKLPKELDDLPRERLLDAKKE